MTAFAAPEPITAALSLSAADIRIHATQRTDTTVEVRPADPAMPATSRPPNAPAWSTPTAA